MNLFELRQAFANRAIEKHPYISQMHREHARLFEYAEFIKDTGISKIEILDGKVILEARESGLRVLCGKEDKRIAPIEILNFGAYEKEDAAMLFRLIDDGMAIFDIGANIGWYSMHIAAAFPAVSVHAFEPIPDTYAYLEANLALNKLSRVSPHSFGFSDQNGQLDFYFDPRESGGASAADLQGLGNARKLACTVRRLDDFVGEMGGRVDFIKCDVEGAELFVFQGGIETLKRCKPVIFTEMLRKWAAKFHYHPNQIIQLLAGIGYCCFVGKSGKLVPLGQVEESTVETNFFFLHLTEHAAKLAAFQ